jgi:hypothetical protein
MHMADQCVHIARLNRGLYEAVLERGAARDACAIFEFVVSMTTRELRRRA